MPNSLEGETKQILFAITAKGDSANAKNKRVFYPFKL